jgi:diguanylate cyclase (GGDEF)-like protein
MPKLIPPLSPGEFDPKLLPTLTIVKRFCCAAVAAIGLLTLLGWYLPAFGRLLPCAWRLMAAETALGVVMSAFSLQFSGKHVRLPVRRAGLVLALLTALLGIAILGEYALHISAGIERLFPFDPLSTSLWPGRPSPQTAAGLALLGIAGALIRVQGRIAVRFADLVTICLGFLVLMLTSGELFGAMWIYALSPVTSTSPQTLLCLGLLTLVAFLRRAEKGIFSIFMGRGIGSRIARVLGPMILILPFVREFGRQRVVHTQIFSEHYAIAILSSISAALSFVFLMLVVWYIKRMETEIHDLSLRDELTGLYNLRGFSLLGVQALRLAQRSQLPCSVLFIDLDNLKQINDTYGHSAGSAALVETGEILKGVFRETDVIGRVGGDEFATICQCSQVAISIAARRLELASAERNSLARHKFPLNFSIGAATAQEHEHQSLNDLLTLADKAMYEEKKRKKVNRA